MERKVVVVSDNFANRDKVKRYCERSEGYSLVDMFGEAAGFICWLQENTDEVNLVFIDMFLYNVDGLTLLKELGESFPELDCVFMCPNFCENVGRRALELGARLVLDSDFELEDSPGLLAQLEHLQNVECLDEDAEELPDSELSFDDDLSVEKRIDILCMGVGIPSHIRGYHYLREAILICMDNPGCTSRVTRELYPRVAEKFNTSSARVERAIRHAMDVADIRKQQGRISAIFEKEFHHDKHKLTSTEFITLATDKLMGKGWVLSEK